jgi:hypothetical protein
MSCGPSEAEIKKAQEQHDAEVRRQAEEALKHKLEVEQNIKAMSKGLSNLENQLRMQEAELVVQKDKLEQVKTPKFLRTPAEREEQLRSQALRVEEVEKYIIEIKAEIEKAKTNLAELKNELNRINS